ncbi:hypothetical protein LshimejAT787_0903990 [Lyophyllum shimeji]|uniref:Secreted protein n=1 Tax=Lyophyllum shimeji TaxID=47721 RepID=A0A9P3UN39_LYOSH|nr:hypothetical protein LshimejAT787_0903990 [Lyophyllum shimeji]
MRFGLCALVSLFVISGARAVRPAPQVVAQVQCATCPSKDLAGNVVVASSGGTVGVPRFCGYSETVTNPASPKVFCFYNNNAGAVSGTSHPQCPPTTSLVACK